HLHREPEPAALARANGDGASDFGFARVLVVMLGDEVESAAEARGIARGEEVLRCGRSGLAWSAHLLWHRQIGGDRAVARLGMTVAAAGRRRGGGKQWFDLVHGLSFARANAGSLRSDPRRG